MNHALRWIELGVVSFEDARELQNSLAKERSRDESRDAVLLLEHSKVLTLGRRLTESALRAENLFLAKGEKVVRTDRGGEATFHGPGQIILYPVISLPGRRLGIRRFVELGLNAITEFFRSYGIAAETRCDEAGVWLGENKLASVGLRVQRGVTTHGFSINVANDLSPFHLFEPCGLICGVSSLEAELRRKIDLTEARQRIKACVNAHIPRSGRPI